MKKILFSFLFLALLIGAFQLIVLNLNDGFTLGKIRSTLCPNKNCEVKNPPPESVKALLSQNFYYVGKGSQCYVFESEDGETVLKFFRQNRYRISSTAECISHPQFLRELYLKKKGAKEKKLDALYRSCKIAFDDLRDDTLLLYLHTSPTSKLDQKIVIYDKLRRRKVIDGDSYAFMVQKKGEPLLPHLIYLISKRKTAEAEEALMAIAALLAQRMDKGIHDDDSVIEKNVGFYGKKPFYLDVGNFSKTRVARPQEELLRATAHLQKWLETHDPNLALFFRKYLENCPHF